MGLAPAETHVIDTNAVKNLDRAATLIHNWCRIADKIARDHNKSVWSAVLFDHAIEDSKILRVGYVYCFSSMFSHISQLLWRFSLEHLKVIAIIRKVDEERLRCISLYAFGLFQVLTLSVWISYG